MNGPTTGNGARASPASKTPTPDPKSFRNPITGKVETSMNARIAKEQSICCHTTRRPSVLYRLTADRPGRPAAGTKRQWLRSTDFWDRRPGWIYETAEALAMRREPIDAFTVARELEQAPDSADGNRLAVLGGDAALTALIVGTPSSVHAG